MKLKDLYHAKATETNHWKNLVKILPNQADLIEELLAPAQLMLIAGRFGIGKTNELFHLLFSFAYGGTFHGLQINPAPILYIGWEGHPKKIAERLSVIEALYNRSREKVYHPYIKMMDVSLPLDILEGQDKLLGLINDLNPIPQVILLDPFKRTIRGDYLRPKDADEWIKGATQVAVTGNTAIIASIHTRKLLFTMSQPEDQLSADRVKGASDLLDGVSSSILYAEIRGSKRVKEKDDYVRTEWATLGTAIKVLKAKDAHAEFPLLKVKLDHKNLRLAGKQWVIEENKNIVSEEE